MVNKISVHLPVRSISLPSRLHPTSLKIEEELTKLKSSSTSNSTGAESIQLDLSRLTELFICIEELTKSPQTQQSLLHHQVNQVEDVLDGSIALIDSCSIARDLFLTMKEHIQDLQSAFRRRGKDSSIASSVQAYVSCRKNAKKDIMKSIKTLKRLERNTTSFSMSDDEENDHLSYLIKVMKEAQAVAVSIFQSIFLFLSLPVTKMNLNEWSLISKLMIRSRFHASDKDQNKMLVNEVERVDIALFTINGQIRKNIAKFDVNEMQERLKTLDAIIQKIEAKLDCLSRCLIQNRVSLLNLLTP